MSPQLSTARNSERTARQKKRLRNYAYASDENSDDLEEGSVMSESTPRKRRRDDDSEDYGKVQKRIKYIQDRLPSDPKRPRQELKLALSRDWTFKEHREQSNKPLSRTLQDKIWTYCLQHKVFSKVQPGYITYCKRNGLTDSRVSNLVEEANNDGYTRIDMTGFEIEISIYSDLLDQYKKLSCERLYDILKALNRKLQLKGYQIYQWCNSNDHSQGCEYTEEWKWLERAEVHNGTFKKAETKNAEPASSLVMTLERNMRLYNVQDTKNIISALMKGTLGIPEVLPIYKEHEIEKAVEDSLKTKLIDDYLKKHPLRSRDDLLEEEEDCIWDRNFNTKRIQIEFAAEVSRRKQIELAADREERETQQADTATFLYEMITTYCADLKIPLPSMHGYNVPGPFQKQRPTPSTSSPSDPFDSIEESYRTTNEQHDTEHQRTLRSVTDNDSSKGSQDADRRCQLDRPSHSPEDQTEAADHPHMQDELEVAHLTPHSQPIRVQENNHEDDTSSRMSSMSVSNLQRQNQRAV